jgi:hypothetical protein
VYGLFKTKLAAEKAARRLRAEDVPAQATVTVTRTEYWRRFQVSGFWFRVGSKNFAGSS